MTFRRLALVGLLASACASAPIMADETETTKEAPGWLKKDFAEFSSLLEGRWDNERHRFFASDAGVDPATLAPRAHIEFTALVHSEADEKNYAFESNNWENSGEFGQLNHSLEINTENQTIAHSISNTDDVGCLIEWSRNGGQFSGVGTGKDCASYFGQTNEVNSVPISTTLSSTEFWVTSANDDAPVETRFRKARPFECWAAILRGAKHGDSGNGVDDWYFKRGVKIHDQGGVAVLETDEEPAHKVKLKLRDVDWTYGTNRPSLTLYVMEGDDDRAVSYAWTEGGSDRVGINLRWIQVSCTKED